MLTSKQQSYYQCGKRWRYHVFLALQEPSWDRGKKWKHWFPTFSSCLATAAFSTNPTITCQNYWGGNTSYARIRRRSQFEELLVHLASNITRSNVRRSNVRRRNRSRSISSSAIMTCSTSMELLCFIISQTMYHLLESDEVINLKNSTT